MLGRGQGGKTRWYRTAEHGANVDLVVGVQQDVDQRLRAARVVDDLVHAQCQPPWVVLSERAALPGPQRQPPTWLAKYTSPVPSYIRGPVPSSDSTGGAPEDLVHRNRKMSPYLAVARASRNKAQ